MGVAAPGLAKSKPPGLELGQGVYVYLLKKACRGYSSIRSNSRL